MRRSCAVAMYVYIICTCVFMYVLVLLQSYHLSFINQLAQQIPSGNQPNKNPSSIDHLPIIKSFRYLGKFHRYLRLITSIFSRIWAFSHHFPSQASAPMPFTNSLARSLGYPKTSMPFFSASRTGPSKARPLKARPRRPKITTFLVARRRCENRGGVLKEPTEGVGIMGKSWEKNWEDHGK